MGSYLYKYKDARFVLKLHALKKEELKKIKSIQNSLDILKHIRIEVNKRQLNEDNSFEVI